MSCIHYKFRSALEYDTITFDGLSISLADLKRSIITQKKFGKNSDFDLEVTNAQTKEEYKDEMTMIPKNSSVVVRRIPVGPKSKAQLAAERSSPFSSGEQKTVALIFQKDRLQLGATNMRCESKVFKLGSSEVKEGFVREARSGFQDYQVIKSNKLSKVADLANADASEEDKLKAMMKQSGEDWDPSQYVRGRRPYAPGVPLSQSYVCFRCGKPGHFIRNCPTNGDTRFDVPKMKRTTGIPRTFLGTLEDRSSPTNMSSPSTQGEDSKTKEKGTEPANKKVPSAETGNKKVPSELRCPSCNNLLTDAVLIPCCGTSYCDDCIRNYLLENEQECPSCGAENVSPDSLVINKQLRQAVNTFKNARPASPFPNQAVVTKSTSATSVTVANSTEVKQLQSAAVDTTESANENAVSNNKPPESKVKQINDADNKTKESSPKPVKQVTSQPQQIRVHRRDGPPQQAAGLHQGGAPFDPRRRQGDFLPRGPPRIPEPIIPHGLPPEHVPRVPAVRPGMGGPHHPGPPMKVHNYVPASIGGMRAVAPRPTIPRMPPVPTLVGAPLPHRPPFGPPMFDPLHHPSDIPRALTPPMSEREFYKIQKKLKSRTKKKREHSSATSSSSSRPRKEPKTDGGDFDFDDELSEYRELQKSRQRLRSRSLSPSRSLSRSPSRSRSRSFSRSRSRSRSSASLARSPTPEGWDESRSPSPVPSRSGTASAEEKRRKHKKRKKEQKNKGHKKQKTSHKEEQPSTEQKEETTVVKEEEKGPDKKKRKKQKEKADGIEEEKDKLLEVGKEKFKKEVKATREKEKGKRKEKDKKKLSDKEKGKETEKQSEKKEGKKGKEGKDKKKRKDKDKKDESSSGKKRKSKKKHRKHKRHKKEKSKEEKTGDEDDDKNVRLAAKEDEHQDESSDAGNREEETATDDEKDEHGTDQAELQDESSGSEETERMDKGEREGVGKDSDDETLRGLKEIDEEKLLGNGSDDDEEQEEKIEQKLKGNGSDIEGDQREEKLLESDKENDEQEAEDKLKGDASDGEEEQRFKGSDEKQLESRSEEKNDTDGGRNKKKQGEDGGHKVERQENRSDKETGNRMIGKTKNGKNETTHHDHISLKTTEEENGNHKIEQ